MATADDIKRVRQSREESQEAFAAHFGVDQSTVHRWETVGPPNRGAGAVLIGRTLSELERDPDVVDKDAAA